MAPVLRRLFLVAIGLAIIVTTATGYQFKQEAQLLLGWLTYCLAICARRYRCCGGRQLRIGGCL